MTKRKIDVFEYSNIINKSFEQGIFLTTKFNEKVNSMIIGWGTLGVIFEKPIFIVYVRNNRFTHELLEKTTEFTINVPVKGVDKNALRICGSKSGRDLDKIKECNFTLVEANKISVPGIKEVPLTIECKVIYKFDEETEKLPLEIQKRFYRFEKGTYHTAYYGDIVDAYMIEE